MARDKKDTLALFEVIHEDKRKGRRDPALQMPRWWKRGPVAAQSASPVPGASAATLGAAGSPAVSSKQGVWFRLTSMHLAMVGLLLVLVVGAAYWAGRGPREPVLTRKTEVIKKDTANPGVMDVGGDTAGAGQQDSVAGATQGLAADGGAGTSPKSGSLDAARVPGRNYIVVQSYPEISTANEAREYLAKSGIPCTVEKGIAFAPKWYCVVTVAGFEKVSSREYEDCVRKIQSASNRLVSPKFKKFLPQAFSWR